MQDPSGGRAHQGEARHQGGSGIPQLKAVGTLTEDQLREIAETKLPDLNANNIDAAMEIIAGTARSMGVRIEGREMKKNLRAFLKGRRDAGEA